MTFNKKGGGGYYGQRTRVTAKSKNLKLKMSVLDLFLTNTQLFTSQDINLCIEVVWIIVMFLSAVWTLILTAPIHCRGSIGEQVM